MTYFSKLAMLILDVWGDGSEARDICYIDDLVDFVDAAIDQQHHKFRTGPTHRELEEELEGEEPPAGRVLAVGTRHPAEQPRAGGAGALVEQTEQLLEDKVTGRALVQLDDRIGDLFARDQTLGDVVGVGGMLRVLI